MSTPRNVLSVPVIGEGVTARLFAFDKAQLISDDLVVGLILGRQIVAVLEQHFLMVETRQSAANQERIRVARELHDGVAQSLAAATFHVRGLRQTVASDPDAVRTGLDEIERLLVNEQRELRLFMQELRPWTATTDEGSMRARMLELCHRVSSLWGVEVELEESDEIGQPMAWEVYRLAQEGLINAARHAQATRIRLAASRNGNRVSIRVADNGHGFPFEGEYDLATLEDRKIGPVSLKERIASLRGELTFTHRQERHRARHLSAARSRRGDMTLKILLADDHPLVLDGLENLFRPRRGSRWWALHQRPRDAFFFSFFFLGVVYCLD